jgi:hypothetical protein
LFVLLYAVSLIFLTNFQLGPWLRSRVTVTPGVGADEVDDEPEESKSWSPEERVLAKKARDLEKQAKKLQDQLDKDRSKEKEKDPVKAEKEKSVLGADMRPVPTPTVRDLSVPTANPRAAKTAKSRLDEPVIETEAAEGVVISAKEIAAATTSDILGKNADTAKKDKAKSTADEPADAVNRLADPEESKPAETPDAIAAAAAPAAPPIEPKFNDNSGSNRRMPLKKKPIAVAATPMIGNYQLPPMDFLQYPDTTVKPTESKEELIANARLMQQTLAQFGIEVTAATSPKGPPSPATSFIPLPA